MSFCLIATVADVAPQPVWGSSGSIAPVGMATALRGVPTVSSRQRCVHGQQGEVNRATKNSKSLRAIGAALSEIRANQSAFAEGAAVCRSASQPAIEQVAVTPNDSAGDG